MSTPPPRVFLSHSSKDHEFCVRLVEDLRRILGDEDAVWYDAHGGLHGGDAWWDKIEQELSTRNIFLLVLSPEALDSVWVKDEINIAWQRKNDPDSAKRMRIVPLLYRQCEIRLRLKTLQIISFLPPTTYEAAFREILVALDLPSQLQQGSGIHGIQHPPHMVPLRPLAEVGLRNENEADVNTFAMSVFQSSPEAGVEDRTSLATVEGTLSTPGLMKKPAIAQYTSVSQPGEAMEKGEVQLKKKIEDLLLAFLLDGQFRSTMIQIARKVAIGLASILTCVGLIYIIIDIVQAVHGHSPSWWIWAVSILVCSVGGTVYGAIEEETTKDKKSLKDSSPRLVKTKQSRSFLSIVVNILKFTVIFIIVCNFVYIIVNIIQAFLGHSPVWWVWVISPGVIPLEFTITSYLSSLGENRSFLSILANVLGYTVALIIGCNFVYIIVNIIQAFLGYSPVWWVWVASLAAILLESIIYNYLSSLEDGKKRQI